MLLPPLRSLAIHLRPPDPRPVSQIDDEIREELEFHIDMRAMGNQKAGMSPQEARRDALRRFGDFASVHRSCRRIALGERIMLQRVQTLLTIVLLAAVVFMGVALYRNQRANEAATLRLTQAMEQLAADVKPPVVVETFPKTGSTNVAPTITEIRVTYSKPMMDRSWSWVQTSADSFPKSTGEIHYLEDGKTCVMPVSLEPGKEYTIVLNSETFRNFKDATGEPAVPYLLHFKTRSQ